MKQSKKNRSNKKWSVTPRSKKGLHMTGRTQKPIARVGLFDMPKFSDIMPFLKEVIQEKATGVKFKSSDIEPPVTHEPPSFRDIMMDEIEDGRITYNKARGFAEAKISAEERVVKQIVADT